MLECNEMFLNFPGWHQRLNSKAGMGGLSFYRLVPLLRREATLMELALRNVTYSEIVEGQRSG